MKKILSVLLVLVACFTFAMAEGTNLSAFGIYTVNLDDSKSFGEVFPIIYLNVGVTKEITVKIDDYITNTAKQLLKVGDTSYRLPLHYSVNFNYPKLNYLKFDAGKFQFKNYSYDIRGEYQFRIGGFRDEVKLGAATSMKFFDWFKVGGYFDSNYDFTTNKSGVMGYGFTAGYDTKYQRASLYVSKDVYNKLNLSVDGYTSIKLGKDMFLQLFGGAGCGVNTSTDMSKDLQNLASAMMLPKTVLGAKYLLGDIYTRGLFFYDFDKDQTKNTYYIDIDSAPNSPLKKTWLYEFGLGYQMNRDLTLDGFIQGNSVDSGIATDFITNAGVKFIGRNISLTVGIKDINGRTTNPQNLMLSFTTWTDFNILPESLLSF